MRRNLKVLSAWCYDLLWFLTDLRLHNPRLFARLAAALFAVLGLAGILVWVIGGDGSPQAASSQWDHDQGTGSAESGNSVRYVPYNGLAAQDGESSLEAELAIQESNDLPVVMHRLSNVLTDDIDESTLKFGSDGSEGSILPLDNGVVPSSGPRFETTWEIILPSAGIHAAVVQVGLTVDGAMGSPDNPFVVGWFNRSAVPGEVGNALLGGHRDYQDRDGTIDVGVCWELDETRVGDQVIMYDRSVRYYYVYDVVDVATIRPESSDAVRYLSQTLESVVTLITCSGDFDEDTHSYEERIVVVALLRAVAQPDT